MHSIARLIPRTAAVVSSVQPTRSSIHSIPSLRRASSSSAALLASLPAPLRAHPALHITPAQIQQFDSDGFLLLPSVLSSSQVGSLQDRILPLFRGDFSTGIYPDEWHWREGLSLPHVTREICNAWKSDPTIASLATSEVMGALAAHVMRWEAGSRLAQECVWHKPPAAAVSAQSSAPVAGSAVGFHLDSEYISDQFTPRRNNSLTIWVALDDVSQHTGTLQYIRGSHNWRKEDEAPASLAVSQIHAPSDAAHLSPLQAAASAAGVSASALKALQHSVTLPAGSLALHHQDLWHGSGPNFSTAIPRRAIALHLLRADVQFRTHKPVTYIYGRYARRGSSEVAEDFFPITFAPTSSAFKRSPWLADYCADLLGGRGSA